MPRWLQSLLFVVIGMGLTFGMHYYLWRRLVKAPALPSPWREAATVALVVLGLSVPAAFVLSRVLGSDATRWLTFPAFVWIGLLFLLVVFTLGADLVRGLAALAERVRERPVDPGRRLLLARIAASGVALVSFGLGGVAVNEALRQAPVRRVRVGLPRLRPKMSGTTIVQLSDLHIGPTLGREWVAELVARVNELKPDIVAITGDLVDGPRSLLKDQVAPLAELKAPHGVYFVTGNHEYYSGVNEWIAYLEELGIRVLRNEHVVIGGEEDGFTLAGVDDSSAHRFGDGHGENVPAALAGCDPRRECVLLAHQPRAAYAASEMGVGLQLSGHTHAGQIWPFKYFVRLVQPVVEGMGLVGKTQVYVSRGTGFWGPPMRLAAPSEITHITLEAAA